MKGRKLVDIVKIVLLTMSVIVMTATQGGCESKSKTEFVGFPQSFADLAEKVRPAVVNISTTTTVRVPGMPFQHFFGPQEGLPDDFFKQFFGQVPDKEMK